MRFPLVPLALAASLIACAPGPREPLAPSFGDSVRHNMAVHIIRPESTAPVAPITIDGGRAAAAYKRLQSGKVKEPKLEGTSSIQPTSGGS